jgi:hypothetical protein
MRVWTVVVLACGCGRIGFNATTDGATSDSVTSSDGVVPAEACPTFASFCDGFESGNLVAWSTSQATAATLTPQSSIVHSGHYALEAVGQPSTSFAGFAIHGFPTQTSGIIATREWVYAPMPLMQWEVPLGVESGSANNYDYANVGGGDNNIWIAVEGDASAVLGNYESTAWIAQSTWVCVELDVMLATTGSTLVVYVADQEVVASSLSTPSPAYNALVAGLGSTVTNIGATAYVDDVVMAAQHIGCQ